MIFSVLLIALCLLVSIIGAWTDIKTGRVLNLYLLIVAGIGAIIYSIATATHQTDLTNLPRWGINLALSILLSIVFYLSDIWAPGDAKLFMLVVALYPILCEDMEGKEVLIPGKTVICALGQRSRSDEAAALMDSAPFVRVIGDASRVSTITNAVYWGYHAALDI